MCVADRARGLRDQCERAARSESRSTEPRFCDEPHDVEPGDELDGRERLALRDAELGHPRDPWMLEAAVRSRSGRERLCRRSVRGELGQESLDRELPLEAGDAVHLRARYRSVGATADRLQQLIAPDALGGRVLHRTQILAERTR